MKILPSLSTLGVWQHGLAVAGAFGFNHFGS